MQCRPDMLAVLAFWTKKQHSDIRHLQLSKPVNNGKGLSGTMHTKYRSGVGKLMHMMQYSRPEIYNSVRDLASHMTKAGEEYFEAMLCVMKYCAGTADCGLVLQPTWV